MVRGWKRWSAALLTVAMGVAAPVAAMADDGSGGGGSSGGCAAILQEASAHPGWMVSFKAFQKHVARCSADPQGEDDSDHSFGDLGDFGWAATDISLLTQLGVIQGEDSDHFAPASHMTRAEFAALLTRLFALPAPSTPATFVDVSPSFWGYSDIEAATPYMTNFNTPGGVAFEPNLDEVRIEVAATIGQIEVSEKLAQVPSASAAQQMWAQFSDGNLVPQGLQQTAAVALELGLMKGYPNGTFGVDGTLTRAEAAVLLARVLRSSETIGTVPTGGSGTSGSGQQATLSIASIAPNTGPVVGGTPVVITGSGFVSGVTVKFGDNQATNVQVWNDTVLTAVAPAGAAAGTVAVSVTLPNGTAASSSTGQYTYMGCANTVTGQTYCTQ